MGSVQFGAVMRITAADSVLVPENRAEVTKIYGTELLLRYQDARAGRLQFLNRKPTSDYFVFTGADAQTFDIAERYNRLYTTTKLALELMNAKLAPKTRRGDMLEQLLQLPTFSEEDGDPLETELARALNGIVKDIRKKVRAAQQPKQAPQRTFVLGRSNMPEARQEHSWEQAWTSIYPALPRVEAALTSLLEKIRVMHDSTVQTLLSQPGVDVTVGVGNLDVGVIEKIANEEKPAYLYA